MTEGLGDRGQGAEPGNSSAPPPQPLTTSISVTRVGTHADRSAFLALPRRIRRGLARSSSPSPLTADPSPWVEPLRYDQARFLDPSHPFYDGGRAAEAAFFLARGPDGQPLGRIAAIDNHLHNQHLQMRQPGAAREGFFGFFDSADDPGLARALLGAAEDWLRARDCRVMLGPASPSHNYEFGVLVDGFDVPHRFMLVHNPPYYRTLLENTGLQKARDLYAFTYDISDRSEWELRESTASRFEDIWRKRYGSIHIRSLDMRRWNQELRLAVDLVNRSLEQNWGYSPITEGELKELAESLRYVVDPELVLFAEHENRPIGVVLALPDLNEAIARLRLRWSYLELAELLVRARLRRFTCARTIALGVARDYPLVGVGPLLFLELFRRYQRKGIRYLDASWVLEDNEALLRSLYRFRGVPDRTYRVYQKRI